MRAQLLHNLIDSSVQNDTNKFYSYDNFQDNLYQTVSDLVEYPGIVDLIEGRASYLSSYPGFQGEPEIAVVEIFSEESTANDTILIKAHLTDATEVFIAYRNSEDLLFSKERMNDAGLDGDAIEGDSIFFFNFSLRDKVWITIYMLKTTLPGSFLQNVRHMNTIIFQNKLILQVWLLMS